MASNKFYSFKVYAMILTSSILLSSFAFAKKNELPAKVEEMILEPSISEMKPEEERDFVVKGGTPPYVFKTSAGFIRYKDNTATYYSPNRPGPAKISVKDARGEKKVIVFDVVAEVPSADSSGN